MKYLRISYLLLVAFVSSSFALAATQALTVTAQFSKTALDTPDRLWSAQQGMTSPKALQVGPSGYCAMGVRFYGFASTQDSNSWGSGMVSVSLSGASPARDIEQRRA